MPSSTVFRESEAMFADWESIPFTPSPSMRLLTSEYVELHVNAYRLWNGVAARKVPFCSMYGYYHFFFFTNFLTVSARLHLQCIVGRVSQAETPLDQHCACSVSVGCLMQLAHPV